MIRLLAGLLAVQAVACHPLPLASNQVAVAVAGAFRAQTTAAHVHHYLFELRESGSHALVASLTSNTPSGAFSGVANGSYVLTADAQDAANLSLVVGGPQTSANTAAVSGSHVTYSAGSALAVTLQLQDSVGGTIEVSVTAPFNAGYGNQLVRGSTGAVLTDFQATNGTYRVKHLPDDTYTLWTFAHNGAGLATPPQPTGPVTVSADGATVSGGFSPNIAALMTVMAGDGNPVFGGDGGPAVNASLQAPWALALDADENLYVGDSDNNRVRLIPKADGTYFGQAMSAGRIYTIAGDGNAVYGGDGGPATAASIYFPWGVELDHAGNVYVADSNYCVRMIPKAAGTYWGQAMTAGHIYTVAGDCVNWAYAADGVPAAATPVSPSNVAFDEDDNLYIADYWNHRVRMVPRTSGTYWGQAMTANSIYTVAGDGNSAFGGEGGLATAASLSLPWDVLISPEGHLIVSDYNNSRVRMLPAANGTHFGVAMTAGNLYTIAGDGNAASAGDGGAATAASLNGNCGLALDEVGSLYVADWGGNQVRMIRPDGTIYTVAGTGAPGFSGDGGLATSATFSGPVGIVSLSDGSLLVGHDDHRIVKIR